MKCLHKSRLPSSKMLLSEQLFYFILQLLPEQMRCCRLLRQKIIHATQYIIFCGIGINNKLNK